MEDIAQIAAERSLLLPIGEVFYLINEGFTAEVNKYNIERWIRPPEKEDIMDKYSRYLNMVGPEEFQTLQTMICYIRLTEKTCSQCGYMKPDLKMCSRCKLTFYCSDECHSIHWNLHQQWCRRRFKDVRDTGPAGIVLFRKRDV